MKIIYFTDSHIMGRNPGARIDDYPQALYNKHREIEKVVKKEQPDAVIHGGDLFDQPRIAYSILNQYLKVFRRIKRNCPVYLVPGNHDLYGYSMSTVHQTAIGILQQAGVVTLLTSSNKQVLDNGLDTVAIHGYEYHPHIDKQPILDYQIDAEPNMVNILFSHGMLLEKPFHPDVPCTLTKDVVTDADIVLNGHYHPGMPLHKHGKTLFGNPGSTGRDEGNIDNQTRIPQYAVITISGHHYDVEYREFKCAEKGTKIFDRTQIVQKKQNQRYLEAFEQTIEDALNFESYDPKDILNQLQGIDATIIKQAMDAIVAQEQVIQDGKLDGYIEKKMSISISEIELENFQSHKKTKVELNEKGLNALTGMSDSGKSAIIRALRWVLYNEPKGTDFIRHGCTRATVTVRFSDGSSITRSRTNSSAGEYIVRDSNGKETEFKGFGNNLPIDIANTHQMPKVELSTGLERSLNFSFQLDGHFLLSESPAVRANTIGRLTGVHVVDAAIKENAKKLRQITIDANISEKRIEEINEQLKQFSDLEELNNTINLVKALTLQADSIERSMNEIVLLQDEYERTTVQINHIKDDLIQYRDLDMINVVITETEQAQQELKTLQDLYTKQKDLKGLISELKADLEEYEDLDQAEPLFTKADALSKELYELQGLERQHRLIVDTIENLTDELKPYEQLNENQLIQAETLVVEIKELQELDKNYTLHTVRANDLADKILDADKRMNEIQDKITTLIKQHGGKCPTCSQDISEESIEGMLQHVE